MLPDRVFTWLFENIKAPICISFLLQPSCVWWRAFGSSQVAGRTRCQHLYREQGGEDPPPDSQGWLGEHTPPDRGGVMLSLTRWSWFGSNRYRRIPVKTIFSLSPTSAGPLLFDVVGDMWKRHWCWKGVGLFLRLISTSCWGFETDESKHSFCSSTVRFLWKLKCRNGKNETWSGDEIWLE